MSKEYYTVVIDVEKFEEWFKARKKNFRGITKASIAREIGYSKGYISQLLEQDKYDIEVSARFIGTFLKTFGLNFYEIFRIVPVRDARENFGWKKRRFVTISNSRRYDEEFIPHTYYSR